MKSMQKAMIFVLIITVLGVSIYAYHHLKHQEQTETTQREVAKQGQPSGSSARSAEPALPSTELPLRVVIDDLSLRAKQGGGNAGCRLATEYTLCSRLPHLKSDLADWLADRQLAVEVQQDRSSAKRTDQALQTELAYREGRIAKLEQHCEGVEMPTSKQYLAIWRSAAINGNDIALRQYASGAVFRNVPIMDVVPELSDYRRDAEKMANEAAKNGDLDVMLALAASYNPKEVNSRTLLSQVVNHDGARALALYRRVKDALDDNDPDSLMLQRRVQWKIDDLEGALDHQAMARLATIESDMAVWKPVSTRGAANLGTSGSIPEANRAWCAR